MLRDFPTNDSCDLNQQKSGMRVELHIRIEFASVSRVCIKPIKPKKNQLNRLDFEIF